MFVRNAGVGNEGVDVRFDVSSDSVDWGRYWKW